jgi:hypothetical protein
VLDGLVGGRSTKQIAYDLGISARTVVHRAYAGATRDHLFERSAGRAGGLPQPIGANAMIVSGFPAPRVVAGIGELFVAKECSSDPTGLSHTDDLVSPVVRNENGRSVPAPSRFSGNNNGMRRGVSAVEKPIGFVRIPAAVVNVEINRLPSAETSVEIGRIWRISA